MDTETNSTAPITLAEHDRRSHHRYKKLKKHIKEKDMSAREDVNIFGAHDGGGFGGGGALGLVALLALLGRRDGFGFGGDGAGGLGIQNSIDTNAILTTLGDIKASVPLAEAQVQLALAGSTSTLTSEINSANIANLQGQANLNSNLLAQTMNLGAQIQAVGNQADRNLYQLSVAITNDGDKTRALIQSIDKQNDSRLITAQANEIIELRAEQSRAADRHGIEINMVNNQNQNQLQFQQQAQVLAGLTHALVDIGQVAKATNQSLIIGNTGAVTGGNQHANPTNVRA